MKRFLIYRYDPTLENDKPKYVSYYIDINKIMPMYLDGLLYVKNNMDSSLSFRRSCREGICGSCAMNCDGLHTLACVRAYERDLSHPCVINPVKKKNEKTIKKYNYFIKNKSNFIKYF
jgi:succinate dehydrogenase (ubiquinone) iron-sulfur subunit